MCTIKNGLFDGFSKLSHSERINKLLAAGILNYNDISLLSGKNPSLSLAEKLIENAISYYPMPLGVAVNFNIDGQDYVIPMAIEETSVIAAASKTAKWINKHGRIVTENRGYLAIGQIQSAKIKNFKAFKTKIEKHKEQLIADANEKVAASMVKRGGGIKDIILRCIARNDGYSMAVIHVMVETCDAMGANIINQICEYFKRPIEKLTKETVNLCILSNLTDNKLTRAVVTLKNIDVELVKAITEAALFAHLDPYRAATNNKGILNGIDAVVLATGNDWRAVEAGIHAYAARSGQYRPICQWEAIGDSLVGVLEAPINVGIVGGVTGVHPTAKLALSMLGVTSAAQLSRVIAAVGLVQNLAALRALTTEGIVQGHMKLHIDNLCLAAGAGEMELPLLKSRLKALLAANERITVSDATKALAEIHQQRKAEY